MKEGGMKKTDSRVKTRMLKEIEDGFDFTKVEKKVVTINLDTEIISYFQNLGKKTGKGYQVLIKEALRYFIEEKLEPKTVWKK